MFPIKSLFKKAYQDSWLLVFMSFERFRKVSNLDKPWNVETGPPRMLSSYTECGCMFLRWNTRACLWHASVTRAGGAKVCFSRVDMIVPGRGWMGHSSPEAQQIWTLGRVSSFFSRGLFHPHLPPFKPNFLANVIISLSWCFSVMNSDLPLIILSLLISVSLNLLLPTYWCLALLLPLFLQGHTSLDV